MKLGTAYQRQHDAFEALCSRKDKPLSGVKPLHQQKVLDKPSAEIRHTLTSRLQDLGGKVTRSDERRIECDFGSLLKSRLLGEFFVSKSTLPKEAIITLEDTASGKVRITLDIVDTHKYSVKWGYVKKYEQALEELASSIMAAF
jgi:hypothetical protein